MNPDVKINLDLKRLIQAIESGAEQGLRLGSELVAVEAKSIAPQRTGQLANSVQASGVVRGSLATEDLETSVSAGAPYAEFVEFGTGVHGPKGSPFFVQPVRKKALRFPVPGGFAFSAGHWVRGMREQPFLRPAIENNEDRIAHQIDSAISNSLSRLRGRR